jgi:hypothetical protein
MSAPFKRGGSPDIVGEENTSLKIRIDAWQLLKKVMIQNHAKSMVEKWELKSLVGTKVNVYIFLIKEMGIY